MSLIRPAVLSTVALFSSLAACAGDRAPVDAPTAASAPAPSAPAASSVAVTAPLPVAASAAAVATAKLADPAPPPPALVWRDFATPESVLVDEGNDRYLVSNINGKPLDVDNNGFVSVLSPDGTTTTAKWIQGTAKAPLNAPKGMGIAKGILYIADIDRVCTFDAKSGVSKGALAVPGATFLNDVAVSADGSKVFVSDSGLKQGATDFEPTGTDAVYVIENGKPRVYAKGTDLHRPNGLLWTDNGLLANTFGAAEVFRLDAKGHKSDVTATPQGGLDGLVAFGDSLIVSSWAGKAVYRGKLGGAFELLLAGLSAPADIALDKKRHRLLVPRFMDNVVEAYDLK